MTNIVKDTNYGNSMGNYQINNSAKNVSQVNSDVAVPTSAPQTPVVTSQIPTSQAIETLDLNSLATTTNLPLSGTIDVSQIDFSRIARSEDEVLAGNFMGEDRIYKEYWGDTHNITYEVGANGVVLLRENGVPMGRTDIRGIQKIITDIADTNVITGPTYPSGITDTSDTGPTYPSGITDTSDTGPTYPSGGNYADGPIPNPNESKGNYANGPIPNPNESKGNYANGPIPNPNVSSGNYASGPIPNPNVTASQTSVVSGNYPNVSPTATSYVGSYASSIN